MKHHAVVCFPEVVLIHHHGNDFRKPLGLFLIVHGSRQDDRFRHRLHRVGMLAHNGRPQPRACRLVRAASLLSDFFPVAHFPPLLAGNDPPFYAAFSVLVFSQPLHGLPQLLHADGRRQHFRLLCLIHSALQHVAALAAELAAPCFLWRFRPDVLRVACLLGSERPPLLLLQLLQERREPCILSRRLLLLLLLLRRLFLHAWLLCRPCFLPCLHHLAECFVRAQFLLSLLLFVLFLVGHGCPSSSVCASFRLFALLFVCLVGRLLPQRIAYHVLNIEGSRFAHRRRDRPCHAHIAPLVRHVIFSCRVQILRHVRVVHE